MTEKTGGIYRLVTFPKVYEFFQNAIGGTAARRAFKLEFFPDVAGKRLLEVGCGPGTWFPEFDGCSEYLGMDWNQDHVDTGNRRFGSFHVNFVCGDVTTALDPKQEQFDYVFAFGILHHLDRQECRDLVSVCSKLLGKDGIFLSVDPVYHDGQNFFAKWMNGRDSGQNIRLEAQYREILEGNFCSVETTICTNKLRIPYSHCVMIAKHK